MSITIFFILNFLLIGEIQSWIFEERTHNVQIPVQKSPKDVTIAPLNHRKRQFGIIIGRNSEFTISIQNQKEVKNFYFYCLDNSTTGAINKIDFKGLANVTKHLKTDYDCVPVVSLSHDVPVVLTIIARKWNYLPMFYSHRVSKGTTKQKEQEFYEQIETYGFVENIFTQMLLTARDVAEIKANDSGLKKSLKRHVEVVKRYIKLIGGIDYQPQSIFLRTNPIVPEDHLNLDHHPYCSHFNVTSDWIVTNVVTELLNDSEGHLKWCLLTKIGRYYEIKYFSNHLNVIGNVWSNLFAYFYRRSINHQNLMNISPVNLMTLKAKYFNSVPIQKWDLSPKILFFQNLFGYHSESTFREFNSQHVKNSNLGEFNDIVYTLIEVFLVHDNSNILGHLWRVNLTLMENTSPRRHFDDLKMRLLSVENFVPKLFTDFGQKFEIVVRSPISVRGQCLYISGRCSLIGVANKSDHQNELLFSTKTSNYYSVYFAEKIGDKFYFSDVHYSLLIVPKNPLLTVPIEINEVTENRVFLPLLYYYVDVNYGDERLATRALINYKNFTLDVIFDDLDENVLYSLTLVRNGSIVFDYLHATESKKKNSRIVERVNFEINDTLIIQCKNPLCKIKINDYVEPDIGNSSSSVKYILSNTGLRKGPRDNHVINVIKDLERMANFRNEYNKTLASNGFYNLAVEYYVDLLLKTPFGAFVCFFAECKKNVRKM